VTTQDQPRHRPFVWLVALSVVIWLVAATAAIGLVRMTGTTSFFAAISGTDPLIAALMGTVTIASILLRFVRWQFLLRKLDIRVPVRGSLSTYLASLVGVATPGHVADLVRAALLRRRFGTPVGSVIYAWVVERAFDVFALAILAMSAAFLLGRPVTAVIMGALFLALGVVAGSALAFARALGGRTKAPLPRLSARALTGLVVGSLIAWLVPGGLLFLAAESVGERITMIESIEAFSRATLVGGASLLPAGAVLSGRLLVSALEAQGAAATSALAAIALVRLTTVGLSVAIGMAFLGRELLRRREPTRVAPASQHFDEIAENYHDQFSPHVWQHLLNRKTSLLAAHLPPPERAGRGLDLGCGTGNQVAVMRQRGYDVIGVDPSPGLLAIARKNGVEVVNGSALALPFADGSFDFAYAIGVLHHVGGLEDQERAFRDVRRVLKQGAPFIIHETNPSNPLFRLYMGYIFPLVRTIDEGTERWLGPRDLSHMPGFEMRGVNYFTFFPDTRPLKLMPVITAMETYLERSWVKRFSAHYCAVLRGT
jgi:ubiquinone/menaquinone biosynthesis C-methylase UbiE/uncharacterized membrane protein YbhN (UPF0104 family)